MKLTTDEQQVLLALSELEPATLQGIAVKTGIQIQRLKAIFESLARKGLLQESTKDIKDREPSTA